MNLHESSRASCFKLSSNAFDFKRMDEDQTDEVFKVKLELKPDDERQQMQQTGFKVYKRRWAMLALFIGYSVPSAFQVFQYTIIANVVQTYYQVEPFAVNWTSTVYMLSAVIAIFPATWFYNRMGLRPSMLWATGGTCVGCWIKVFSVRPDLFWVTMLGQTISALCSSYVLNIQVPLAATWFGPQEVSTACSIGTLGAQIGGALGFLIPVALMPENEDIDAIARGLNYIFYGLAIFSTLVFILQCIFLQSEPPTPPGNAQAIRSKKRESVMEYLRSQFRLLLNLNFALVFITYSVNLAVFSAVSVYLSQMILPIYPNAQADAGYIGVLITFTGMIGSVLAGFILDRTRLYREMNIGIFAFSAIAMIAYSFILRAGSIVFVYIAAAIFGIALVGYWPTAFEFAAELTYPEPEASSAGMMIFGCQLLSALYTLAYGWVFEAFGDLASNLFMSGSLLVGTVLSFFVKSDLRRQEAERSRPDAVQNVEGIVI